MNNQVTRLEKNPVLNDDEGVSDASMTKTGNTMLQRREINKRVFRWRIWEMRRRRVLKNKKNHFDESTYTLQKKFI
jgi:hypothetical protein